jgi:hypothetical protein
MAGAVLAGAGLATVPSAANATNGNGNAHAVDVPCNTPALIGAINAANLVSERVLNLAQNCIYTLTTAVVQPTTRGPDGLPIIRSRITLVGKNTTIKRDSAALPFRIIEVAAGAHLNVRGLTISGGNAGTDSGGGILNARGGVLLFLTLVHGNTADNGAGISNDSGALRLVSSTVRDNRVRANGGGGGGIYNDGFLSIKLSRVNLNRANTNGGGLFNELGGRAFIFRSDIIANTAELQGGGIFNGDGGNVRADRVRVQFNQATDGGGAFDLGTPGTVVFKRSIVKFNSAPNCAPAGAVIGCVS